MADEWQDVAMVSATSTAVAWLESQGLSKYAAKIVEVTDAETVDDLKLVDAAMADEVVKAADLKLVTAKKFREALAELRGESTPQAPEKAEGKGGYETAEVPVAKATVEVEKQP